MLISLKYTKKNIDFPYICEKSKKKHRKGAKMNKKQLVAKISSSMSLSKADAERTFDGITDIILSHFLPSKKQVNSTLF